MTRCRPNRARSLRKQSGRRHVEGRGSQQGSHGFQDSAPGNFLWADGTCVDRHVRLPSYRNGFDACRKTQVGLPNRAKKKSPARKPDLIRIKQRLIATHRFGYGGHFLGGLAYIFGAALFCVLGVVDAFTQNVAGLIRPVLDRRARLHTCDEVAFSSACRSAEQTAAPTTRPHPDR